LVRGAEATGIHYSPVLGEKGSFAILDSRRRGHPKSGYDNKGGTAPQNQPAP
jgi:hypothetical protein